MYLGFTEIVISWVPVPKCWMSQRHKYYILVHICMYIYLMLIFKIFQNQLLAIYIDNFSDSKLHVIICHYVNTISHILFL